jgi:hypothetical protein
MSSTIQPENTAGRVTFGRQGPENIIVPFLAFSGLLLAALIAYVTLLMPVRTPQQAQNLLVSHKALQAFIEAKEMVEPLLPSPATRWSGRLHCGEIGHGVWFADGMAGQETLWDMDTPIYWKAVFNPATDQPLFLVVGDRQQGDLQAALRAAGLPPTPPPHRP